MQKYKLTKEDILLILSGMIRAGFIARGEYPDFIFRPGPLPKESRIGPQGLNLGESETTNLRRRAEEMFGGTLREGAALEEWAEGLHAARQSSGREEIVFHTSGSTGEPKPNAHDHALLAREIECQKGLYPQTERIVSFVFPQHIYGFLFTIMLPKALGCPALSHPPFPSRKIIDDLRENDLVVGFPLFWDKLLDTGKQMPPGVRGATSTAPCPRETILRLMENGFEKITEIYGSSETGGIGTRSHPDKPYTLLSCWNPPGPENPGHLTREHPASKKPLSYPVPDAITWLGPDTSLPGGRTDSAVQVAGTNVYPKKIENILLKHPKIRECAVRLMRPEEGFRLKAFVVPQGTKDPEELRRELAAWMKKHLTAAEIPKKINLGSELPKNAMGKIQDW